MHQLHDVLHMRSPLAIIMHFGETCMTSMTSEMLQVVATGTGGLPIQATRHGYAFNIAESLPKSLHIAEVNPIIFL